MDCPRIQQIVSETLDRAHVDPAETARAREHCRACAECAAFVRRLEEITAIEPPAPPADLLDRIVARALDEHAALLAAAGERATTRPLAGTPVADSQPEAVRVSWDTVLGRARKRPRQTAFALLAAATVLAFTGWAAVAGMRAILVPPRLADTTFVATGPDSATEERAGSTDSAETQAESTGDAAFATASTNWITVDGSVYRMSGPVTIPDEELGAARTTMTALDSGSSPARVSVRLTESPDRVVLVDEDTGQTAFDAVTRTYDGRVYVLRSGQIDRFGDWPTLPSGIREPLNEDGSPTFVAEGTDSSGVPIYRRAAVPVSRGIAVAPGAPFPDPVAGAPVWTWWEAR